MRLLFRLAARRYGYRKLGFNFQLPSARRSSLTYKSYHRIDASKKYFHSANERIPALAN